MARAAQVARQKRSRQDLQERREVKALAEATEYFAGVFLTPGDLLHLKAARARPAYRKRMAQIEGE